MLNVEVERDRSIYELGWPERKRVDGSDKKSLPSAFLSLGYGAADMSSTAPWKPKSQIFNFLF